MLLISGVVTVGHRLFIFNIKT